MSDEAPVVVFIVFPNSLSLGKISPSEDVQNYTITFTNENYPLKDGRITNSYKLKNILSDWLNEHLIAPEEHPFLVYLSDIENRQWFCEWLFNEMAAGALFFAGIPENEHFEWRKEYHLLRDLNWVTLEKYEELGISAFDIFTQKSARK